MEKERNTHNDDSLNVSLPSEVMQEINDSALEEIEDDATKCNWCYCTYVSTSSNDMAEQPERSTEPEHLEKEVVPRASRRIQSACHHN